MTDNLETYCQFFKALSEPLRIRVLHLLMQRDSLCVCELVEILEAGQSTVSRHLAYLKNAQIIDSFRQGAWMHYQLLPNALTPLNLEVLKNTLAKLPSTQSDLAKLIAREQAQQAAASCKVCEH
ncbi:ArsR/SmtB family transcription factor [Thiosulfativibrio zosterae]|uniref:Transcriptional regulator n=1 Tax=Thiosulfativibrio zosterae TaxID=2675053 RepID=A0A6F8PKH9_9GAMM|nr:metalloregulator ArsR/SmtB family transcription factor [Thiosulfativibrio zosterae]BBP42586.1 transcriptional regulator [Thiosulfativibrio zosterae]